MDPNYATLHEFLQAFAPEVGGRSSDGLTPDLQDRIRRAAGGELGEEELRDLSRELLANENALERFASLLKEG